MPRLTIAVQCQHFERRLCWMLSSILQQTTDELPKVDIAHQAGVGDPTCEAISDEYMRLGLQVHLTTIRDTETFQRRGLARNIQCGSLTTPWVLWADADMVYHPEFFVRLYAEMDTAGPGILTAGRWSQPNGNRGPTEALVETQRYPTLVNRAYWWANRLPKVARRNCGAGYFQLIRTEELHWYYVDSEECKDHDWRKTYSKCKSDRQFRKRIGTQTKLPKWFSEHEIHLNHNRDNEIGRHIEEQR